MEHELAMMSAQAIEPDGNWLRVRTAGIVSEKITPHVVCVSPYGR